MRTFFSTELETVATYWQVYRKDGVALGFSSHDSDLYFDGIRHQAAPGMVPAAIRKTNRISPDSAEISGALTHETISAAELAAGLFDEARVEVGAIDWITLERQMVFAGELGRITDTGLGFTAELVSAKSQFERELVPRTSPTCRAQFCGPGCGLSASRFTRRARCAGIDFSRNRVRIDGLEPGLFLDGLLRFVEGPQTGITFSIIATGPEGFLLDRPIAAGVREDAAVQLREGCDHTIATCGSRFSNGINFRGEPFLPGNDLVARYASPK